MRNFKEYEEFVLRLLKLRKAISTMELRKKYSIGHDAALDILKRLVKEGKIIQYSTGNAYYYTLP